MTRWAFNIVCGLSLIILLAVIVLWARSAHTHEMAASTVGDRYLYLGNGPGIAVLTVEGLPGATVPWRGGGTKSRWGAPENLVWDWHNTGAFSDTWSAFGLSVTRGAGQFFLDDLGLPTWAQDYYVPRFTRVKPHQRRSLTGETLHPVTGSLPYLLVIVPHWMAASAFALLPLYATLRLALVHARRRRRSRLRICPMCGYDLRASPERCPECGAAAPKASESTLAP